MSLSFPYANFPPEGELVEIVPDIFWLKVPLPYRLNHVNLWLLRDERGWCVIDTGFASKDVEAIWENVISTLDGPITRLIVTHFHPDHLGFASQLAEKTGASLWMSTSEFLIAHTIWNGVGGLAETDMIEAFQKNGLSGDALHAFKQRGARYRQVIPHLPGQYNRLKAGDTLSINKKAWRVFIGHGHSPEHIELYSPEHNVLIAGDMLLSKISTNITVYSAAPRENSLGAFLAHLVGLQKEVPNPTLVLPSHDLPFYGVHERINELQLHHQERLRLIREACQNKPMAAADLLEFLFGWTLDTHQLMFAMGETIAHLNHLVDSGQMTRIEGADGIIRFTLTQGKPQGEN